MRAPAPALALTLCLAVFVPAADAQPKAPLTREQALADMGKSDIEARRQAAAWLGEVGAMADAPVLLRALRDADEVVRALAEHSVWQVWSRSGDAEVDALFQVGLEEMKQGAPGAAIETFTAIVQRKPDFAEGWNKRATLYFMVGEYQKSLRDCDEVVKRNPEHFGVLSGYGQIYLALDQPERALDYFQRALNVNPNLRQVEAMVEALKRLIAEKRKNTI
jgi:tetratricopeptide (TPR) repeat protein